MWVARDGRRMTCSGLSSMPSFESLPCIYVGSEQKPVYLPTYRVLIYDYQPIPLR
ncbi:hypothetical protein BDA96_05G125500 [Sorghum bicolor]|uniref:Uncharacterized protein n=1 Tax=Sorghum bicolor TaxID=4558 RepID=A0A921QWZ9_SORBI|nr:hypothetical protein BDA96_05G125500 [Sorghum bicolor]KAG0529762.1 hypothetical protein BDA96_05G125500 [Sorghum bicolor]KAG0529763.1 hypothetical protein BDA96_05G125500 [Sorghum bicolor]KAG0529766.1 hypothetical protein BDA96_05G125500 [Sorghum bicolor]KAG0529767.1 hypothetical protein BDA96_05G125500 [Sorghum bicolor]